MKTHKQELEEWVSKNEADFLKECPLNSGLKIGDKVTFTNDFGVVFKNHKVLGFTNSHLLFQYGRCVYLDLDCYWMPIAPKNIKVEIV